MPSLAQIGDSQAVDSQYADKVIVYVESEHDEEVYRRFVGPNIGDRLEFKTPKTGASGWAAVRDRVRLERPSNDNVWGLLDGEAVVHFDSWRALIDCPGQLFDLATPDAEGLIFVSGHELENLLMLHGEFCELIVKDVRIGDLGKHTHEAVRKTLMECARRFFASAALKYSLAVLERAGASVEAVKPGKFRDRERTLPEVIRQLRKDVTDAGLDWPTLRRELRAISERLQARFAAEGLTEDARADHYVRLADGKALMAWLRDVLESTGPWDGHLVDASCRASFARQFREELLQLTAD